MLDAIYKLETKQCRLDLKDVASILPEVVVYSPEPFCEGDIIGIDYNKLVVLLISTIQHHKQEIDLLKQQMANLIVILYKFQSYSDCI